MSSILWGSVLSALQKCPTPLQVLRKLTQNTLILCVMSEDTLGLTPFQCPLEAGHVCKLRVLGIGGGTVLCCHELLEVQGVLGMVCPISRFALSLPSIRDAGRAPSLTSVLMLSAARGSSVALPGNDWSVQASKEGYLCPHCCGVAPPALFKVRSQPQQFSC